MATEKILETAPMRFVAPGDGSALLPPTVREALIRVEAILPEAYYKKVHDGMLADLRRAAIGEPSSLALIPNRLPTEPLISDGIGQSFVYGGTNFDIATVQVKGGKVVEEISRERRILTPETSLYDVLREEFDPRAQAIAGNVGQQLDPTSGPFGELDGIPTTDGVKGQSLGKGKPMGESIRKALGRADLRVTVANDTVAIAEGDGSAIIGTGTNKSFKKGPIIYNIESGGQEVPMTPMLERVDAQLPAIEQGQHLYEKRVSGKYLPIHFNLAAEDLNLDARISSGEELSRLAATDQGMAGHLARALLHSSAHMEAAQFAAIRAFSGKDSLTFVGDGGLIRGAYNYSAYLAEGLAMFGVLDGAITITKPEDVAMRGAKGLLTGSST